MKIGDISIRYKLFFIYASAVMSVLGLYSVILYYTEKDIIEKNMESNLDDSTKILLKMVKASVTSSIRSNLRGIAERNLDIVRYIDSIRESKGMSPDDAMKMASEILCSQTIGRTGYIYVINSKGELKVHPGKKGLLHDVSGHEFVKRQIQMKNGYLEYSWANPGESTERPKALYMVYFEPWDWIISVSSYRNEFINLVNVDDFKEGVLASSFGKTGYSFIIDSRGKLLVHPKMEGENIIDSRDFSDRLFIKELCERKSGRMIYPWKNPGDDNARKKLVIFNYVPEMDWIVASSSYFDDFYSPLNDLVIVFISIIGASVVLVFCLSYMINESIINQPIKRLVRTFSKGASGDFSVRAEIEKNDEIGRLGGYFNRLMQELGQKTEDIKKTGDKYRSIIEGSVEGIFLSTPEGRFIETSPSMARILGYESPEELIRLIGNIGAELYVDPSERVEKVRQIIETSTLYNYEVQFYRKDRGIIWASVNARAVFDDNGELKYIEGFATDITESKKIREEILESRAKLEEMVNERTAALTRTIQTLKKTNMEIQILHEASQVLQACSSLSEVYTAASRFTEALFPDTSGAIYISDTGSDQLVAVVKWGKDSDHDNSINNRDCWALKMGRTYCIESHDGFHPACDHVHHERNSTICVPVMSGGGFNGLFTISFSSPDTDHESSAFDILSYRRMIRIFIEHFSIITSNLRLREDLTRQSNNDPLTGLYNRRYMNACLSKETGRMNRRNLPLAVMMIDIDHFKSINDTYGHAKGDEILKNLAAFLMENLRVEDTPCRYGGEEFLVIMPETDSESAFKIAERIRTEVPSRISVYSESSEKGITISIGLSVYPSNGRTLEKILAEADKALYISKQNGRNRTTLSDSLA